MVHLIGVDVSMENPMGYRPSFKDTLMGEVKMAITDNFDFIFDDEGMDAKENEDDCPTVRVSMFEKDRLRWPWKQTLIIKVMGMRVGYAYEKN